MENGKVFENKLKGRPMWTMIARHGFRYHFANDTFVSLCGLNNLYVGDYVEYINGKMRKVGEARQVFEAINEYHTCKKCLMKIKRDGNLFSNTPLQK